MASVLIPLLMIATLGHLLEKFVSIYPSPYFWVLTAVLICAVPLYLISTKIGPYSSSRIEKPMNLAFILVGIFFIEKFAFYDPTRWTFPFKEKPGNLTSLWIHVSLLTAFLFMSLIAILQVLKLTEMDSKLFSIGEDQFNKFSTVCWKVVIGALFVAKPLSLIDTPDPGIDVFTTCGQAVDYLLDGFNPYVMPYRDLYHGWFGPPGLNYWPGYIISIIPFHKLLGDLRTVFIFCDSLTLFGIFQLCRRWKVPMERTFMVMVLWFSFPITYFVLQQAWTDSLLICAVTWSLILLLERRWILAGVLIGFACSQKQYAPFVYVTLGALHLLTRDRPTGLRVFLISSFTFLTIMLPFAFLDWDAFFYQTFQAFMGFAHRRDALSLNAALLYYTGSTLPNYVHPMVILTLLPSLIFWLWRTSRKPGSSFESLLPQWAFINFLFHGVLFYFGRQAFWNYYFYSGFYLVLWILPLLGDVQTEKLNSNH